jgi:hypothetical protein
MPFLAPLLPAIGIGAGTVAGVGGAVGAGATAAAGGLSALGGMSALGAGASALGVGGSVAAGATAAAAGTSILSALPNLLMSGSSLLQGLGQSQANSANAEISKVQAKQARLNAAYNERRQREDSARLMGEQAARFGASGVAMEGTPLLVMADQARQSELEALAIRNQGKMASEGYLSEAEGYKRAASSSLMGGLLKAAAYGGGAYGRYKGYY